MKKTESAQKLIGFVMFIMIIITASVGDVNGQVQQCEGVNYSITATGTGCSKAEAKLAMRMNAAGLAVGVCPGKLCPQDTVSPCVLKLITIVTGITFTQQNDNNCPPPHMRWTATRAYSVSCKCIHVPQPQRDEVMVPDDPIQDGALSIFPNPAIQQVSIDVSGFEGEALVQLVNVLGQQVFDETVNLDELETYKLSVSSFPAGIYKVVLRTESNAAVGTFVKGTE
jgi:hypothetical protein